jgi:hypothetical protein
MTKAQRPQAAHESPRRIDATRARPASAPLTARSRAPSAGVRPSALSLGGKIGSSVRQPARLPPRSLLKASQQPIFPGIPPQVAGPQSVSHPGATDAEHGRDVIGRALASRTSPLPATVRTHFARTLADAGPVGGIDDSAPQPLGGWLIGRPDSPAELRAAELAARAATSTSTGADVSRGVPFGSVRVHDDRAAARAANALGARAFSLGEDIFFAAGQYEPSSSAGRALIIHELAHVLQARDSRPVIMRQLLADINKKSQEYLRGHNDGRANKQSAPGPLTTAGLAEYDAGYSNGLAEATKAQASLPPVVGERDGAAHATAPNDSSVLDSEAAPPDAAKVERITERMRELRSTYTGSLARPILDRELDSSDYRLTPSEIAKLRTRAESLRQVVRAMQDDGFGEDASMLSHVIGDLFTEANFAEVQWRQLSQSAKSYWLMKRDHPEWQVAGNPLLDMTGAIVDESQSADVQFVMSIFVAAMTAAPPRRPASPPKPYAAQRGELLGSIPGRGVVGRPYGSAPYGQAIEPEAVTLLRQRFPETEFNTSNTGKGGTGPDVVWTGGKDPGFNIADFKPDSNSGWAKFFRQARLWSGGPMAKPGEPFRAAMLGYRQDMTLTVLEIGVVGGPGPIPKP